MGVGEVGSALSRWLRCPRRTRARNELTVGHSGQSVTVHIVEFGRSSATLRLTTAELSLVNNALNEVSRGVHELDNDNEFATRLGSSREDAKALQSQTYDVLTRADQLPRAEYERLVSR